ncbi:MAG TPA: M48 family metallopeptidase [Candidatus Angelobacter sp.]|nr:M48 family metallopeptidase [Candidatus Angelobacter sp.]
MSLKTRAIIAIALMVGFYLLALGIAFGLVWIPYAQYVYLDSLNLRLAFTCIAGAGIILWAIFPRQDNFVPPGPRLDAITQPRLFSELKDIAQATNQEMPQDVYLVSEMNAWVAQRGGILGIGSRRIMVLGLPLMALLNRSQFRAVLAHEFGHYYAGDTKLGVWIYKTRTAIWRTVTRLGIHGSFLFFLFKWYNEVFLRITLAISRAQEHAADRLAAQLEGANALIEGLKQLHRGAAAWQPYLQSTWLPIVSAGYVPSISQGLQYFLQAPQVNAAVEQQLEKELSYGKAEPLDSHPALPERIATLQGMEALNIQQNPASSLELFENLQEIEKLLTTFITGKSLQTVPWSEVLDKVWLSKWREQVVYQQEALREVTTSNLADELQSGALRQKLKNPPGMWPTTEERARMARTVAGCALALLLYQEGWAVHTLPGEIHCERNGESINPFELVKKFGKEMSQEQWLELCTRLGLKGKPLLQKTSTAAAANSSMK